MKPDLDQAHRNAMAQTRGLANALRRLEMTEHYFDLTGGVVQTGPFLGMQLLAEVAWGDGDKLPKLLGCYEAELHGVFERLLRREHRRVVNVGAAEGYYAIGLALKLAQAEVIAFEMNERAQAICRAAAERNGVAGRLRVAGACDLAGLGAALAGPGPTLLVMDCEGGELELLDPARLPALAGCDIVVECHDFANRSITPVLIERLAATHRLERIEEGPRDPNRDTWLRTLPSADRWLAVTEGRPETMSWLVAWAQP